MRLSRRLLHLIAALVAAASGRAAVFTVTTTADSGPGSLRSAIEQSNNAPSADTIAFNIPGGGTRVITLLSQLPDVGHGTTVDGTTQPGYAGVPLVVLSGLSLGTDPVSNYRPNGLVVRGDDCLIRGLSFLGFRPQAGQPRADFWDDSSVAIRLHGARDRVTECILGLSPDGMSLQFAGSDAANSGDIQVRGRFCTVENVTARGVAILEGAAEDNVVRGCTIGFRRDGTRFTPAEEEAGPGGYISLMGGQRNTIGQPGMGNRVRSIYVIGATGYSGDAVCRFSTVAGNTVARSAEGASTRGGILVSGETYDTLIGGSAPGSGNLVYGEPGQSRDYLSAGIIISEQTGPWFDINFYGRRVRVEGNTVEGVSTGLRCAGYDTDPAARVSVINNTFRGCSAGIRVDGFYLASNSYGYGAERPAFAGCFGNTFPGNLASPVILGRNNFPIGGLTNDPLDADAGSNGRQNFPVLETVTSNVAGTQTIVTGRLDSMPSRAFRIELYSSLPAAGLPAAGDTTHGTLDVTTNAAGTAVFSFTVPGLFPGRTFSALASDMTAGGLTSTMSPGIRPATGTFTLLPSVVSVSENGTSATVRVRRNGGSYGPATVQLAADGLITASADLRFLYNSLAATPPLLTFQHGETEQLVDIFAFNDVFYEPAEIFTLTLTSPTGFATVTNSQTLVLAGDNDAAPSISVNDAAVNETAGVATFILSLSAPSGRETRVTVATADGTATAPADYGAASSVVVFAPGEVTRTAQVAIVDSFPVPENSETFFLNLSSPVNATLGDAQGMCTITDLDGVPPSLTGFRFFTAPFSTAEGGFLGMAFVTIERTGSLAGAASVHISTDLFSAGAADVTPLSGQVVPFADGEQFQTITLSLHEDTLDEADEFLVLRLSDPAGPGGAVLDSEAYLLSVILQDDDAMPVVKILSAETTEGDDGSSVAEISVSLSTPCGRDVWVGLTQTGGDAGATDFTATAMAVIPAGSTTAGIPVTILGDYVHESTETATFVPWTFDGHPETGENLVIYDNDPAVPAFRLEGLPGSVSEGAGELLITLRRMGVQSGTDTCRVKIAAGDGSVRLSVEDFTFAPGEETAAVRLVLRDDFMDEPDDTVTLSLLPVSPAVSAAPGAWSFTVTDDDDPPVLNMGPAVTVLERDAVSVTAEVSILLSAPSAFTVSALGIYSFPGTAASGTDYTATGPLDISFAPGETVKTITVTIAGDYFDEADESFSLILPDSKGATRGISETTVFIQDNDTAQRPYRDWLLSHFNAAERRTAVTDPCADPDGDQINNALEFFLDSNPRSALSGPDAFFLSGNTAGMTWSFAGRASRAAFVQPQVEISKQLASDWSAAGPGYVTIADYPGDLRQYKVSVLFADTSRLFLRLNSTCPPFEPEP